MKLKLGNLGVLYLTCATLLIVTILGCVLYVQRDLVLVYYHTSIFLTEDEPPEGNDRWLCARPNLSAPVLLSHLSNDDHVVCRRASTLLERILDDHPDPTNPEASHLSLAVAARLHQDYPRLSRYGRAEAVELAVRVLASQLGRWSPTVPTALETAGEVLLESLADDDLLVVERALGALAQVWHWNGTDNVASSLVRDWKQKCYRRAMGMLDGRPDPIRAWAARAITGADYHEADQALIGMLSDPNPAVKKAALLALTHTAADSLSSEKKTELLSFLYDPDLEIREAARQLLLKAGATELELNLATRMNHPVPTERARVVAMVLAAKGIDQSKWLFRLSNDPAASVRFAAANAAGAATDPDLQRRLHAMADSDPDPQVRAAAKEALATKIVKKP